MKTLRRACVIALALPCLALAQQPRGKGGGHHPPPPEALAACQGKADGAACSFTHEEHVREGTCFSPSTDKPLACRPAHQEGPR